MDGTTLLVILYIGGGIFALAVAPRRIRRAVEFHEKVAATTFTIIGLMMVLFGIVLLVRYWLGIET